MKALSGTRNWLQKFGGSVVKFAGTLIPGTGVYMAETQKEISETVVSSNIYLQERRETLQVKQMELSALQYHDNKAFQMEMAKFNQENQQKLQQYRTIVELAVQDKNFNFQQWKLEQEKTLQLEIISLKQEFDRELARYNRETALNNIREQRRLVNSPINLVSDDLLESPYRIGDKLRKNSFSQLLRIVFYISDNTKNGLELIGTAIAIFQVTVDENTSKAND